MASDKNLYSFRFDRDLINRLDAILENKKIFRTTFLEDFIQSYCELHDLGSQFWKQEIDPDGVPQMISLNIDYTLLQKFDAICNAQDQSRTAKISDMMKACVDQYEGRILDNNFLCDSCGMVYGKVLNCPECSKKVLESV